MHLEYILNGFFNPSVQLPFALGAMATLFLCFAALALLTWKKDMDADEMDRITGTASCFLFFTLIASLLVATYCPPPILSGLKMSFKDPMSHGVDILLLAIVLTVFYTGLAQIIVRISESRSFTAIGSKVNGIFLR